SSGAHLVGIDSSGTGTAISTTINSGGVQYVGVGGSGFASNTTINSSGTQYVQTGTAVGTTIFVGGLEIVAASGGTDSGAQVSGGEQDVFGVASGATIFAGSQVVGSGG